MNMMNRMGRLVHLVLMGCFVSIVGCRSTSVMPKLTPAPQRPQPVPLVVTYNGPGLWASWYEGPLPLWKVPIDTSTHVAHREAILLHVAKVHGYDAFVTSPSGFEDTPDRPKLVLHVDVHESQDWKHTAFLSTGHASVVVSHRLEYGRDELWRWDYASSEKLQGGLFGLSCGLFACFGAGTNVLSAWSSGELEAYTSALRHALPQARDMAKKAQRASSR